MESENIISASAQVDCESRIEELTRMVDELQLNIAIKEEEAYRKGRNDAIEEYLSQSRHPYISISVPDQNNKDRVAFLESLSRSVWD